MRRRFHLEGIRLVDYGRTTINVDRESNLRGIVRIEGLVYDQTECSVGVRQGSAEPSVVGRIYGVGLDQQSDEGRVCFGLEKGTSKRVRGRHN